MSRVCFLGFDVEPVVCVGETIAFGKTSSGLPFTLLGANAQLFQVVNVVQVEKELAQVAEEKGEDQEDQDPGQFGLPLAGRAGGASWGLLLRRNRNQFSIMRRRRFSSLLKGSLWPSTCIRGRRSVGGAQLFCLSNLENDPAVEEGEKEKREQQRESGAEPVDVVVLIVGVHSECSGLDVCDIVGPVLTTMIEDQLLLYMYHVHIPGVVDKLKELWDVDGGGKEESW